MREVLALLMVLFVVNVFLLIILPQMMYNVNLCAYSFMGNDYLIYTIVNDEFYGNQCCIKHDNHCDVFYC